MFTMMTTKCQKSTTSQKENLRETGNSKIEQCVKPQIQDQLKRGVNKIFNLSKYLSMSLKVCLFHSFHANYIKPASIIFQISKPILPTNCSS